jgi:hypothetical protein
MKILNSKPVKNSRVEKEDFSSMNILDAIEKNNNIPHSAVGGNYEYVIKMENEEVNEIISQDENRDSVLVSFKIKKKYNREFREFIEESGFTSAEFWRRAAFVVMRDPSLLSSVDDLERGYRRTLGPSRHHKLG